MEFEGKVAVITGGASGIGRATAERLGRDGAIVVLADVQETAGRKAAQDLSANQIRAEFQNTDVSQVDEIRALIAGTRVHRLLSGYRDRPPAALAEIELVLVKLSQLAADQAGLLELDINPLLADSKGITVLDARIRVARATGPAQARLAIRPYPSELEQRLVLDEGKEIALRPIRPEDEPALRAGFEKLSPSDVRMRFFAPLKELDHRLASRLSQIDYTREMAFVAYDPEAGDGDFWGVVRINSDPDGTRAEFAVVVRSDIKRRGLGCTLLEQIIAYSRDQGIAEIWGTVLAENKPMLALARKLGFAVAAEAEDPAIMKVVLELAEKRAAVVRN